jgi:hypothetical protein
MSGPRYHGVQDPGENGLSMLRQQYANANNPQLAWRDDRSVKQQIEILGTHLKITLTGDPALISSVATLICRTVKLAKYMADELEPQG